jgi:hypothetical protein
LLIEVRSHCVAQVGLEQLGSSHPPASDSQLTGSLRANPAPRKLFGIVRAFYIDQI